MSAVYFSYSGFVGSDHFVFDWKYMKNDGLLSVNAVMWIVPLLSRTI
jgi:hypothetical protein